MPRERKKTKKDVAKAQVVSPATRSIRFRQSINRCIRVVTGREHVLGMNMFAVIVDDTNFMPEKTKADVKRETKALNASIKANKPEMLVIAESAMSRREIEKTLTRLATDYVEHRPHTSQMEVVEHLHGLCDQHHWSNFQRRRTVEQIAAKVCGRNSIFRLRRLQRRVDATMAASKCRG